MQSGVKTKMKIIAFYLPQFHETEENNKWWGDGFTEWTNVRNAKPLYKGHNQPRVPLNNNYYNLLEKNIKYKQVELANKYGIYGFCFYHYWFDGKLLLQKPVEQFLADKNLNTHFCICWANEHWTNAWANKKTKVLIEQKYGEEKEWKEHFYYLLPFFKDKRYIKIDNKPLFVIYRPELINCLHQMLQFLDNEAKSCGFSGLSFAYQHAGYTFSQHCDESIFDYAIEYHPNCAQQFMNYKKPNVLDIIKKETATFFENKLKINIRETLKRKELKKYDYDKIWNYIVNMEPRNDKCIPGAFVDWDNTPRKGERGFVIDGGTPKKFEYYMTKQIKHAKCDYKKDMMFIFAWNEWAEGGYLEPDEKNKYGYLEAIKSALEKNGELEK